MSTNNICTSQELKKFADSTRLTIDNFSKFIESKTNQKYLIVQREFITDLNKQLFNNTICILDIKEFLSEVWEKVAKTNQTISDKWRESLKILETQR
jgi:hypothetical protein